MKKGVVRTKPRQIGLGIEDIDQENRQMHVALRFVQKYNNDLQFVLQHESLNLQQTWDYIENNRELSLSLAKNASALKSGGDEGFPQVGNLERNLQFQIFQLDQETRKIEGTLRRLRNSSEFYQLIELTTVEQAYRGEIDRLSLVKISKHGTSDLSKKKMLRKMSKRVYLADIKISDAENTLIMLETEIETANLEMTDRNKELTSLEAKIESLEEDTEAQKHELNELDKLIGEYTLESSQTVSS